MPRTTPDLVEGIIDVEPGVDVTPFITIGNNVTTRFLGSSGLDGDGIGTTLEIIERWLSAHYYAIFDAQTNLVRSGTGQANYNVKINFGLQLTHWGQTAMFLDTTGTLARQNNIIQQERPIHIKLFWTGRRRFFRDPFGPFGDVDFGSTWCDLTTEQ